MRKINPIKELRLINLLCEGVGIRSCNRLTGVHRRTIILLRDRIGRACAKLMEEKMKDLKCQSLQVDEMHAVVKRRDKFNSKTDNGVVWIYVAIDPKTKIVPLMMIGQRNTECALKFCLNLQERLSQDTQIHTDHMAGYARAVGEINQLGKKHHMAHIRNFSVIPNCGRGNTNNVETHNSTMRQLIAPLRRRGKTFAKSTDSLQSALAMYLFYYNFIRPHGSLGKSTTPAMAAGLSDYQWTWNDLMDTPLANDFSGLRKMGGGNDAED